MRFDHWKEIATPKKPGLAMTVSRGGFCHKNMPAIRSSFKLFCIAFISVVFLYLPETTTAQNTSQTTDTTTTFQLDEVIVTANRFEQEPSSVGRNVTVISQQEIQNSIYYSVGELLAEQQSVHLVGSGQTPGSLQTAFIRNSNGDNSVVLIDGVRISDPSSTDNSLNLAELSLANVQRIEIVRGSHSTLYGSSAIGGVINIITKNKSQPGFNGSVETKNGIFSGDTYSTANNVFGNYTWTNGLYVNGAAAWQNTRGLDATIDTLGNSNTFSTTDRDEFEKLGLTGKLGFKNDRWDTFVSYRRVDQLTEVDQGAFDDDDNAFSDFQRDLFNYRAAYKASDQLAFTFSGGYSDLQRDFENDSSVVDQAGNFDGSFIENNAEATLLENEITAQYKVSDFTGTAGIGNTRQTMNIETFTFIRSFNFESSTDLDSLDLKENISHVFLHTEWGGGLIDESLESFSLGLGGRLLDHNEFGTNATFEINPKVQITPEALVYGAITTGFNAPSLFQLNSPNEPFGAFTNRGNKDLDPETSISYELGWKQQIGSGLQFKVALFKTEVEDVIEFVNLWDGNTPIAELTFSDFLGDTYLNASRQDIKGLEVGFDAQVASRLSFHADVSVTDSELSFSPGNIDREQTGGNHVQIFESGVFVTDEQKLDGLTRRPSFTGNFNLNYRPVEKLSLKLASRFVGNRDDVAFNSALGPFGALDFNEVDAYNLTDLSIRYEATQYLALNAKAENIFDEEYVEINGFRTKGRGFFLQAAFTF
jgi:vitamin B12 transporter